VAAGEDQPEPVVAELLAVLCAHGVFSWGDLAEHERVDGGRLAGAVGVHRLAPRGHRQPAAGIGRDAVFSPGLSGRRECLGGGVLGRLQVAEPPGERRDDGTPFLPEGVLEGQSSTFCHAIPEIAARTSTVPPLTAGIRVAQSSAASRSGTSIR